MFKTTMRNLVYRLRFHLNSFLVPTNDPIRGFQVQNRFGYGKIPDITKPTGYNEHLGCDFHEIYQTIIRPYIHGFTKALEVGSGRGSYTRGLLDAKEVWVLEAQPRWMTRIDEFLQHPRNLTFIKVEDTSCRELPDSYFDYFLSMATFYTFHDQQREEYLTNLFSKMKHGAQCFLMIGDWEKYKRHLGHYPVNSGVDVTDWKYTNADRMADMLERIGWRVVTKDVGVMKRDTIIHFTK